MQKILGIYGAGGFGRSTLELAQIINNHSNCWEKIVFVDNEDLPPVINGISVVTEDKALQEYGKKLQAIVAVGEPFIREKIYLKIKKKQIELATLIHPSVHIPSSTVMGEGVIIYDYVTIAPDVEIQDNTCIQPQDSIGHDVKLGKHCVISPCCSIGGMCTIGDRTFMGFLSGLKQGVQLGKDVVCSGGAIVFRDVEDGLIVVGNPARVVKRNETKRVFS